VEAAIAVVFAVVGPVEATNPTGTDDLINLLE
jgi:hypothetical protein